MVLDDINKLLKNTGLFTIIESGETDHGWNDVYKATKLGNYTISYLQWLFGDSDYYNFHVDPHKTVMGMLGNEPYVSNGILCGSVYFAPFNPNRCPRDVDMYENATFQILISDFVAGNPKLYNVNRTTINTFDPYFANIPLEDK
ncbi:MAG: hypothetical protein LBV42_01950 [Methanobrevibacter sp.]|nr:hypothetical protein [Methanobrevibacter sp.]